MLRHSWNRMHQYIERHDVVSMESLQWWQFDNALLSRYFRVTKQQRFFLLFFVHFAERRKKNRIDRETKVQYCWFCCSRHSGKSWQLDWKTQLSHVLAVAWSKLKRKFFFFVLFCFWRLFKKILLCCRNCLIMKLLKLQKLMPELCLRKVSLLSFVYIFGWINLDQSLFYGLFVWNYSPNWCCWLYT